MEDKRCKQKEPLSAITTGSDDVLSLGDKFKQRYKIKINNIQRSLSNKKRRNFR